MAIERPFPKDVSKFKKTIFKSLSIRDLFLGIPGIGIIIYSYFFIFNNIDNDSLHALLSALTGIIPMLIAWYKPYDLPFEKFIIPFIIDNIISPSKRYNEIIYKEVEYMKKSRSYLPIKPEIPKIKCQPSKTIKGIK